MSASKKPRSDAVLKTLPAERQAAIAEYARDHSLADTRAWLAQDGVKTSVGPLSEFLSWFALRSRLARNETVVSAMLQDLARGNPSLNEEQLFAAGQQFFSALAIEQADSETWARVQRESVRSKALVLARQRFQRDTAELFLQWSEDQRAKDVVGSGASQAEKIERLGQLMFGAEWK